MDLKRSFDSLVDFLKESLNINSKSLVGLDIGLSSVKIAEIEKISDDKYKLINFTQMLLPEGVMIDDEILRPDDIIDAIQKGMKGMSSDSVDVCIGLGGSNTVTRKLQLAGGTDEEIEDQVYWEAEQYLPFPIDDCAMSFHIIGDNIGGGVDVLMVASRNDIVESFRDLVEDAGNKVKIIDMNIVAITNLFEHVFADRLQKRDESRVIIDFGAQKTEFIVYKNGSIVFTKEINIGGISITEEIQRKMGVNYEDAEDLKITGDENGNLPEEILEIIDDVIEAFFIELKKTMDFYVTATSDESLVEAVVMGGGVLIPGFIDGLESVLGVEVNILNPFDKIIYDKKRFSDEEINTIVCVGGVALGLAIRAVS